LQHPPTLLENSLRSPSEESFHKHPWVQDEIQLWLLLCKRTEGKEILTQNAFDKQDASSGASQGNKRTNIEK